MTTANGFKFSIKNNKCVLEIPITKGCYSNDVQIAQNEICMNDSLPYFKEIVIKKVGTITL